MTVSIRSGDHDVLACGQVTAFRGEPVEFVLEGDEETIRVVCRFETGDEPAVITDVVDDQTLEMTFAGFANPLGTGSPKPVEVGSIDGRPLWFHFRVRNVEGTDPTLGYTFYLEDE